GHVGVADHDGSGGVAACLPSGARRKDRPDDRLASGVVQTGNRRRTNRESGDDRGANRSVDRLLYRRVEPLLTKKIVNTTISSCSTSKSSTIRRRRRWLWSR